MNEAVLSSLIPVVLFIGLGVLAGRMGWVRQSALKDLTSLVFMVLTPALLFRTMVRVDLQSLDFRPVLIYFSAAALILLVVFAQQRFSSLGAARGLACTFSNTIMIGIPLVGWVYGEAGLVALFTLIAVHALVLLTLATVFFELAKAKEATAAQASSSVSMGGVIATTLRAVRNGILHPVPVPIIAGLLFAQSGWVLPAVLDESLLRLGQALGPIALMLVGLTLAFSRVGENVRMALLITVVKNLLMPACFLALGWALGLRGLPLAVLLTAACLPTGANVYLFAMTYGVAQDEAPSAIALSTIAGLFTVPLVLMVAVRLL